MTVESDLPWVMRVFDRVTGAPREPANETPKQRLERARSWVKSSSAKERTAGLSTLLAVAPAEAVEPLLAALNDPDRHVRSMAIVGLVGYERPGEHAEQLVNQLGGEDGTARWFAQNATTAGMIGSFGLSTRLLPALDRVAATAETKQERRKAEKFARELRAQSPGWPLNT